LVLWGAVGGAAAVLLVGVVLLVALNDGRRPVPSTPAPPGGNGPPLPIAQEQVPHQPAAKGPLIVPSAGGGPPLMKEVPQPTPATSAERLPLKAPLEIVDLEAAPPVGPTAFVFLEPSTPPTDYTVGPSYGILMRELLRQAVLLAAREECGLTPRDATLGEVPPEALPPRHLLQVDVYLHQDRLFRVRAECGPDRKREPLWQYEQKPSGSIDLDGIASFAETQARGQIRTALLKRGFGARPNAVRDDIQVPPATEALLERMTYADQFQAVRELHALMRAQGESPWVLGALARAYANLGVLTEFHWAPAHKAFKARALLYAQRLHARQPQEPWSHWHRAYARALIGLHKSALADLAKADELLEAARKGGGAAGPLRQPPAWVGLLEALCRFDTARLTKAALGGKLPQLAQLLRFLTVEDPYCVNLTLQVGEELLKGNPECYRVHDSLCATGGVSSQHVTTLAGLQVFSRTFLDRVARMPGVPHGFTGMRAQKAPEPDLWGALRDAGRDNTDRSEPSWAALGALARETRFTQVWRRLHFMRYRWSVPVDDFLKEALPLVQGHRYAAVLETFALDPQREPDKIWARLRGLPLRDLELTQLGLFLAFQGVNPAKGVELQNRATRESDLVHNDMRVIIQTAKTGQLVTSFAKILNERVSPHAPMGQAILIRDDWGYAGPRAAGWEKATQHPRVLLELGKRYAALKRPADSERCLKRSIALSSDATAYQELANSYKAQGQMELWQQTLEALLKEPDPGLRHAWVRVEIANELMKRKEYKKALPYAEAAAQTWAAWAMLCAGKCYEGLGEYDKAEVMMRRVSERYADQYFGWFWFCKRTGKGDDRAAGALVERILASVGGRASQTDLFNFAAYYLTTGQPRKALEAVRTLHEKVRGDSTALLLALAYDEVGERAARDEALKNYPGKGADVRRLVELMQACLARGEKAMLDTEAVENVLRGMPEEDRADCCYLLGRFLTYRGHTKAARDYLQRCATAPAPRSELLQVAARCLLRAERAGPR
jgi:tetratricopeptide (TPR) repeat protein